MSSMRLHFPSNKKTIDLLSSKLAQKQLIGTKISFRIHKSFNHYVFDFSCISLLFTRGVCYFQKCKLFLSLSVSIFTLWLNSWNPDLPGFCLYKLATLESDFNIYMTVYFISLSFNRLRTSYKMKWIMGFNTYTNFQILVSSLLTSLLFKSWDISIKNCNFNWYFRLRQGLTKIELDQKKSYITYDNLKLWTYLELYDCTNSLQNWRFFSFFTGKRNPNRI